MKAREPRRNMLVDARMRIGNDWSDVRIRNVSKHGMMVEAQAPPERGVYIEIRRGTLIVIGRVAWSRGQQFGLRSQDVIDLDALGGPSATAKSWKELEGGDRRKSARDEAPSPDEARSRQIGSLLQYAVFAGAAAVAAGTAAALIGDALHRPLQSIANVLGH